MRYSSNSKLDADNLTQVLLLIRRMIRGRRCRDAWPDYTMVITNFIISISNSDYVIKISVTTDKKSMSGALIFDFQKAPLRTRTKKGFSKFCE
jgi:hypothetical protein